MRDALKSIPLAFEMIFQDPINLFLSTVPTLIALALYILTILGIYYNTDQFAGFFQDYIQSPEQANVLGMIFTAMLIIFVFFVMNWTFIVVAGIISAPFNSLLSSRIEDRLNRHMITSSRQEAMSKISQSLLGIFKNELKKLIFIAVLSVLALMLNLFPILYPLGIFLIASLFASQFLDYSWSRHSMSFMNCVKDMSRNLLVFTIPGLVFLLLITIPLVNALIPALATSYFTVLWHIRNHQLQR